MGDVSQVWKPDRLVQIVAGTPCVCRKLDSAILVMKSAEDSPHVTSPMSDRVVRPLKPGNAGGGKDPDFWRAFEEGEVKVIDKSLQTPTRIRSLQRKLYRKANQKQVITLHIRPNSHEP